jgi:hypothetical protein
MTGLLRLQDRLSSSPGRRCEKVGLYNSLILHRLIDIPTIGSMSSWKVEEGFCEEVG